jgi:hypothetical protein
MKVSLRDGLVALMGVTFTALGIAAWREGTASSAGNAVVALRPPSQVVAVGEKVTLDVTVANVTNLASWEVKLRYDPKILAFESFVEGPFLASTGRGVSCLDPFIADEGATVLFGCASSAMTPPGPDGSGTVATVTFAAKGAGTTPVEIIKTELALPEGSDCCGPVTAEEAAVRVVASQSEKTGAAPPATPTPNPRKLTPTPVNATPGPSLVLTPGAGGGEPPAGSGGVAGAVTGPPGDAGGGANRDNGDLFRSAAGATAGGSQRGSPRAGEGSLARTRGELPATVGSGLAIAGALLVAAVISRQRQGTTGRLKS